MTIQNKSILQAVFRKARIEELKLFISFIKTHDETSTITFDDAVNFIRQHPDYTHTDIPDMNAIQHDVAIFYLKYKSSHFPNFTADLLKTFVKIQEKARGQWIKDFLNATTLDIYKDFEYNAIKDGYASVDTTFRTNHYDGICRAFRYTFTWASTKQGHEIWSIINACYLRCIPISVTNKIYTMLTRNIN